jgi:hypothetical protein
MRIKDTFGAPLLYPDGIKMPFSERLSACVREIGSRRLPDEVLL